MQLSQEGALRHQLVRRLLQGFSEAVLNRAGDLNLYRHVITKVDNYGASERAWDHLSLYSMAGSLWSLQVPPVAISLAPEATREHSLPGDPGWPALMGADIN